MKLGPYELGPTDDPNQGIYTGDARELAQAIPDGSVDLVFTDPVYDRIDDYRWLAETAARVLKPSGQLVFYQAHIYYAATFRALDDVLCFRWIVNEVKNGTQTTIWGPRVLCRTRHLFVYYKPPAKFEGWLLDTIYKQPDGKKGHRWNKGSSTEHWLKVLGGGVTVDFFTGGGTVPAVCKMLGRHWLAFEIDAATADTARERVRNTQPPLFVPEPQQLELVGVGE